MSPNGLFPGKRTSKLHQLRGRSTIRGEVSKEKREVESIFVGITAKREDILRGLDATFGHPRWILGCLRGMMMARSTR
jgi:hypothetical protein